MVYLSDEHYMLIRQQAVERIRDFPQDYQNYILQDFDSVDDYISGMSNTGSWADEPVIRATADALQIEIRVISADDFIPRFRPDNDHPTETIYIGHIRDVHFVATTALDAPKVFRHGGRTSDGVTLFDTDAINTTLSWMLNLLEEKDELQSSFSESKIKHFVALSKLSRMFKTTNTADIKKNWYDVILQNHNNIFRSKILANKMTDLELLGNLLKHSNYGQFHILMKYE